MQGRGADATIWLLALRSHFLNWDKMGHRATASFLVGPLDDRHPGVLAVTPAVDGTPLTKLVAEFEKSQGFDPANGYAGIVPTWFNYGSLDRYLLGQSDGDGYWSKLGGVYLLGCECGEVGCWPLMCKISTSSEDVTWERFRQPHRAVRDYSDFGPFVFDLAQYRNALTELLDGMRTI